MAHFLVLPTLLLLSARGSWAGRMLETAGSISAFESTPLNPSLCAPFSQPPGAPVTAFPDGFVWGTATSAYQVEGGAAADGKGASIWDTFTENPSNIADKSSGAVACNSYELFPEDVQLMKQMGVTSYRFSIAWARILPAGTGKINAAGVDYYNKLIDTIVDAGLSPVVTLYHWDLPQALEDKYGGWLDAQVVDDFAAYADLAFKLFGDRVKRWATLNEPQLVSIAGFGTGDMAPGRCSKCDGGNSSTEPYVVAHHLVLAHAAAYNLYAAKYKAAQGGQVGLVLNAGWYYPLNASKPEDLAACQRGMEFQIGWFFEPLFSGNYPNSMRILLGDRLPQLSAVQSATLKGSYDFMGLNFYSASYGFDVSGPPPGYPLGNPYSDRLVGSSNTDLENRPIGADSGSPWLKVVPESMYEILMWLNKNYPGVPIYITENGVSQSSALSKVEILDDTQRVDYSRGYISNMLKAIKEGVPVKGYYAWSFMDNFEWAAGYTQRFGIFYVDFDSKDLTRVPKLSASWWKCFLAGKMAA